MRAHKPVPLQQEPSLGQPRQPSLPCADFRRVIEQTLLLLLLSKPGEFGMERMIVQQKRLLAVQDRWIGALSIVGAIDLPRSEVDADRSQQGRVRIALEVRINKVRKFARPAMNLDDVRSVQFAQIRPAAAFVNSQERLECIQVLRWT